MADWLTLENQPIYYQPDQIAFLEARRRRWCQHCKAEYSIRPEFPSPLCPTCSVKGSRMFNRMTIIAGRRFGKTRFGSIAALEEAAIPNTIGWACAPTNDKLHRYVIPAFQMIVPPEWVSNWSAEFKDLRLTNGSVIHFQTLEHPDQGRGQGIDWLWIDEVCELTRKHWDTISPSLADRRGMAFFTTSPRSFDWVHDDLYLPAVQGKPGFWALKAQTIDNPKFQDAEGRAEVEAARASLSPEMFAQEWLGEFVNFEGAVYPTFDHLIIDDEEKLKTFIPEWPNLDPQRDVLVGIDTGADHPFGGLKMVATDRGLVVIGEYLVRHQSFQEHAASLHNLVRQGFTATPFKVKWACNKNERQPMIELAQHGISCSAAANDHVSGIERVKSWIYNKQIWFYRPLCPKTIQQLKAYRYAENEASDGSKRVERVYKRNDELPDCLRYALMTWPKPRLAPPPPSTAPHLKPLESYPEDQRDLIAFVRRHDAAIQDREDRGDLELHDTGEFWG